MINQSDIRAVLRSVLCAVVKKAIKLLSLCSLKTKMFLSEQVLMKVNGFLYRQDEYI